MVLVFVGEVEGDVALVVAEVGGGDLLPAVFSFVTVNVDAAGLGEELEEGSVLGVDLGGDFFA